MVKLAFMFTGYNSIAITQASVCKKQVHNKLADLRYHFNWSIEYTNAHLFDKLAKQALMKSHKIQENPVNTLINVLI